MDHRGGKIFSHQLFLILLSSQFYLNPDLVVYFMKIIGND